MTPLRQFKGVPTDMIRKAEGKQFVSSNTFHVFLVLKVTYLIIALVSLFRSDTA